MQHEDLPPVPADPARGAQAGPDMGVRIIRLDRVDAGMRVPGLPEQAVQLLAEPFRGSTVERVGDVLIVVVGTATGAVRLALSEDLVVAVDGDPSMLDRALAAYWSDPTLTATGSAGVLPCVVAEAVETYGPALTALIDQVDHHHHMSTQQITFMSRRVLELRRAMVPLVELLDELGGHATLADRYRGRRSRLRHLVETADLLATVLSNALQAQQNDDMRKISAWGAIWAVPTLLAGVYGMNFHHMPELGWPVAYPLVLIVMVATAAYLYRAFRRSGWL
jgi:magnesium transporter